MSATFTVHLPKDAVPGDVEALERAEIVRDGFSWGAFLVPGLWFLWHRHLGLCVMAFVVVLGSAFLLVVLRVPAGGIVLIELLIHLLFGLEGSSLRRLAYRLRGRPTTGLVIAPDEAEAEAKSFGQWLAPEGAESAAPAVASASETRSVPLVSRQAPEPVLGLFPDFEGRR